MNRKVRFYALIGAVLVVVAGLVFFIRGGEDTGTDAPPLALLEAQSTHGAPAAPHSPTPIKEDVAVPENISAGSDTEVTEGASVAGVVVDSHGNPVARSNVTAVLVNPVQAKPRYRAALTGADGAFKIDGVEAGTNLLRANPPQSYASSPPVSQEVRVGKDEAATGVRIVADFDRGLSIAGRVRDTSGRPIAGAEFVAFPASGAGNERRTRSDAEGHYEVTGLSAAAHRMYVSHADYTEASFTEVDVPNPAFDVTLQGKATVEGRVVDARTGEAVSAFSIITLRGDIRHVPPGNPPGEPQSFANPEGAFIVRVEDGPATLYVYGNGYAPELQHVTDTKEGQTTEGIVVRLKAGGVVEGVVVTETGERVAGAQIYVNRVPAAWELQQKKAGDATSGADGAFRLDSLPEESFPLFALHERYGTASATAIPSSSGTPVRVQIVLPAAGTITGTVRVDGVPEGGYGVSLRSPADGYQNEAEVGPDGDYVFTGVPEGALTLKLYPQRSATVRRMVTQQASVVAGQVTTVDFDLSSGTATLEGSVTRAGLPVPDASVELILGPSADRMDGTSKQTDADGAFQFENLPAGKAAVLVRANIPSEHSARTRSFGVMLEDGMVTRLDAKFDAAGCVTGHVTGVPEGWRAEAGLVSGAFEIAPDANVRTAFAALMDRIVAGARVSADGTFRIDSVDAGTFTLGIVATDPQSEGQNFKYATAPVTLEENGEANVNVTLP